MSIPPTAGEDARPVRAVVAAGVLAGVLDISAAFIFAGVRGVGPIRVLHSISSGLLGRAAYDGAARTAALGLSLHFVIALGAASVYYLASRRIRFLRRRPIPSGLLYGVAVWAFMSFVVIPLSAVPQRPFSPGIAAVQVLIHMACVGLPIALALRRFAGTSAPP